MTSAPSGRQCVRPDADNSAVRVLRVDPRDGAVGIYRDAPVVIRLSHPADPESLSSATVCVQDPEGSLPGLLERSPDDQVLIWRGERPFVPGVLHFVVASGVRDRRGRGLPTHVSRFVPCDIGRDDVFL